MPAVTKFEAGRQPDRCSRATRPTFTATSSSIRQSQRPLEKSRSPIELSDEARVVVLRLAGAGRSP